VSWAFLSLFEYNVNGTIYRDCLHQVEEVSVCFSFAKVLIFLMIEYWIFEVHFLHLLKLLCSFTDLLYWYVELYWFIFGSEINLELPWKPYLVIICYPFIIFWIWFTKIFLGIFIPEIRKGVSLLYYLWICCQCSNGLLVWVGNITSPSVFWKSLCVIIIITSLNVW
jgi:hypothetical protein